jgi:hypothetical protein
MCQAVWQQPQIIDWSQVLLNSFSQVLGYELISREGTPVEQAQALFFASFVLVSHGIQPDPILNYGNQTALQLWEMSWLDFTQTPSRLTAEPINREERKRMLQQVSEQGFIDNYRGIRISSTGKRFLIEQGIVWNLRDRQGKLCGQAATFADCSLL